MAGWESTNYLIRGFEADRDRSGALSIAIDDAHRRLATWASTIEMRFGSVNEDLDDLSLYGGHVYPISATGRIAGGGEAWIDELADLCEAEMAVLGTVLLPVELAGRLMLTAPQTNAAALRVAAHRLAVPDGPLADLTAGLGRSLPRPRRYRVARWRVFLRAYSAVQARSIANVVASTVVDHTGQPRGQVTEVERFDRRWGDPPSERDPDDEIAEIADHAANVAALRSPMLLAGALLLRAWHIEAEEHEFAIGQRVRDLLGNPGRRLVSPQQLHDAELRARLMARARSSAELVRMGQQLRHEGSQYFNKFWSVDPDEMRQCALRWHEGDVLIALARELDAANGGVPAEEPAV